MSAVEELRPAMFRRFDEVIKRSRLRGKDKSLQLFIKAAKELKRDRAVEDHQAYVKAVQGGLSAMRDYVFPDYVCKYVDRQLGLAGLRHKRDRKYEDREQGPRLNRRNRIPVHGQLRP